MTVSLLIKQKPLPWTPESLDNTALVTPIKMAIIVCVKLLIISILTEAIKPFIN